MDLNKLTIKAQGALQEAHDQAVARDHQAIEPEHLLFALSSDPEGVVFPLLQRAGANPGQLRQRVDEALDRLPKVYGSGEADVRISPATGRLLDAAAQEAETLTDEYVSTEHLLLAALRGGGAAARILAEAGLTRDTVLAALAEVRGRQRVTDQNPEDKLNVLEKYGRDLTEQARRGKLDPVIGRDEEVRRTIQVLSRRTKNNPVLIGEGEIITFIDELHTIVGAGAAEGAMDAGNMLKPMLARGELRAIGATTLDEYRQHIEKDPALERRFQPVLVEEPSVEDTIGILRGLKERYEVHHGVRIQDPALVGAAVLSDRYVSGRFLPDKAIDLIDEAASRLRIEIDSMPVEIDEVERRIRQLEIERAALQKETDEASRARLERLERELADLRGSSEAMMAQWRQEKERIDAIRILKAEIEEARGEAERAERDGDLERAAELRYGTLVDLDKRLEEENARLAELQSELKMLNEEVTEEDVAEVVATWTGIPVSRLMEGEMQKLVHLEEALHDRVVDQTAAVEAVANAIRRSRAGLADPHRPIGSFLFLGPTGVGKTELARALAEFLFDDERAMIRIDMSEYQERHTVSRLMGAPPGYVGYEEGGQLTEAVRRRPYSVVLLDEMEKAHGDVFNILLQLLDDGRLTDGQGRTVDFRNTIVIMTSNLGSSVFDDPSSSPDERRERVLADVRGYFRPEFVNRIDEIVVFDALGRDEIAQIVDIQLRGLQARLAERKLTITLTDGARTWLANEGYDPAFGARPLKRLIQREIQDPLALKLLAAEIHDGDTVEVDAVEEGLAFRIP